MSNLLEAYDQAEKLKDEGKFAEAIAKLNEILEQDADYTMAHLALAVVHGKIGDHDKALEHGQKACSLDPNDPFSHTALSVTYKRAFDGTQNPQYIQLAEDAMARAHAVQQM